MSEAYTDKWNSDDGSVTLYCGDCLRVIPALTHGSIDAVVTDPPYGIDYGRAGGFSDSHGWGAWRENVEWDAKRPGKELFDAILSLAVPSVIWGGNYFTDYLPPRMGWIAWDKGQRNFSLADFELAWTSEQKAARCLVYHRAYAIKDGKVHPTQKPVWVMQRCVEYLERARGKQLETICDPFMGSGTTGVACALMAKRFIGIEIDPGYFAIARDRIQRELDHQRRCPMLPGMESKS